MNSWGNDKLEKRIDELLSSSVCTGAEPSGFRVSLIPLRPAFPWYKVAYVLIAAVVLGFFMVQWFQMQKLETGNYDSIFTAESVSGLFSGINSSELVSIVAIVIGLGGTLVAFLSERNRVLHRML